MITEEDKREIIDKAKSELLMEVQILIGQARHDFKEEVLLSIPEVIGNQMASFAALSEQNRKFWGKYPEFLKHKDTARTVIEAVEGKNPLLDHKEILERAVPKIRERINTLAKLNLDTVSVNPPRKFEQIEAPSDNPHGEI